MVQGEINDDPEVDYKIRIYMSLQTIRTSSVTFSVVRQLLASLKAIHHITVTILAVRQLDW